MLQPDHLEFNTPEDNLEKEFRQNYPWLWLATLLGPLLLTILILLIIVIATDFRTLTNLLLMSAASLFLFGRFVILGGQDPDVAHLSESMSSLELFAMVFYLDIVVAMVLAFHLGFLFRIPVLGEKLQLLVRRSIHPATTSLDSASDIPGAHFICHIPPGCHRECRRSIFDVCLASHGG
ncbi:MAG: hypothetical protein R3C11_11100 [Planctomycetaceae bacterium]